MKPGNIAGAISGIFLIIGIITVFLPSPYWLAGIGFFLIAFFIWFTRFTWRVATAADNFIDSYQDEKYQKKKRFQFTPNSDWNKTKGFDDE